MKTEVEMFLRCGEIEVNTCDWSLMFVCKFCDEKFEKFYSFFQHSLKQHVLLNDDEESDEKWQKLHDNAKNSLAPIMPCQEEAAIDDNVEPVKFLDFEMCVIKDECDDDEKLLTNFNGKGNCNEQECKEENKLDDVQSNEEEDADHFDNEENNQSAQQSKIRKKGRFQRSVKRQCPHCPKKYSGAKIYEEHVNRHLGIKPFVCEICERGFVDASGLDVHMKRHLSIKKHLCSECGKAFVTITDFRRHLRTHTKEKPYKCTECPSAFSDSSTLRDHLFHHRNERPFACPVCDKRFYSKKYMNRHGRLHTNERPFECPTCQAKFSKKYNLEQHQKLHSGLKSYECPHCDATYTQYASLFGHLKRCSNKNK